MENCNFCKPKNVGRLKIFRGACTNAILCLCPITEGHLLVIPDVHVKSINELNFLQRNDFFSVLNSAIEIVKKTFSPEGVNYHANEGKIAGQTEEHFHFHVVPRYTGDNFKIHGRKNGEKIPLSNNDIKMLKEKLLSFPKR